MENINIPCKIRCYEEEETKFGLKKAKVYIMHEGTNRNNTSFSKKAIKKAEKTIKNRPLLAYIEVDEDGNAKDFSDHRMKLKKTKNEIEMYYLEKPIGVFPESCNPRYEEIGGVTHFVADCYIWEGYSNEALSLIDEADGEKQVSMEIAVLDSETTEDGITDITDFNFMAVTVLGDDVVQGMNGTCGLEMFSNNSDIEKFTKEITSKIKEIEEGENKMEKDIYGLGSSELYRLVGESLINYMYKETSRWGEEYEYRKYSLQDVDSEESVAIVYDFEQKSVFGIPFTLNENKITLIMDDISKYVSVWKKVENDTETLNFDLRNTQFTKVLEDKIEQMKEEYSKVNEEKEEVQKQFEATKEELDVLQTENSELKEYKETKEKEEKQMALEKEVSEVVSEFDLVMEEIEELTSKVYSEEITIDEFKKELFVLEGMKALEEKKKAKFTKKDNDKEENLKIEFSLKEKEIKDKEQETKERKKQLYGGIFANQID